MREPDYTILAKLRPATSKNVKRVSLVGQKFHRLTVFSLMGYEQTAQAQSYWLCRCKCGNWSIVAKGKLLSGRTKSCGCYINDIRGDIHRTHGMTNTPSHRRWADMMTRCYNPKFKQYADWGGRGIVVCEGFRKFENFYEAMQEPPRKHQVNRIDNDGNYSCGKCPECVVKGWPMNVKWSSLKEQARNKRNTRWITIGEQTKSMAEWIELSGVKQPVAWKRLDRGWTPEEAFGFKERVD